ncbi:MAG TPA: outer membrane protein assembly factor BamE [Herbaspirillum sp.]|jgi:outer membrane protein assembly factor BamE|nr:outer membrane protein assembly factor BamE [Herbaspirillum sp.]
MRMLPFFQSVVKSALTSVATPAAPFRKPVLMFCLAAVASLSGCASWNPWKTTTAPVADGSGAMVTDANAGVKTTSKSKFLSFLSPYKIDIQQGNFVSAEMLAQLKEGMTRDQVRFVLGTPLLTDIFHADRWDYDFRLTKGNGEIIASRVSVFFNGDSLAKWEGGNLPTESEYLGFIAGSKPSLMPAISDGKPIFNPGLPGQ